MRWALAAAAASLCVGLPCTPAAAHPLGNFTVNQYAGLHVTPSTVEIDYVLDLAELPAFQTVRETVDADGDGDVSGAERDRYAAETCAAVAAASALTVDGRPIPLHGESVALTRPPGAAGLRTLRLECRLLVSMPIVDGSTIEYRGGSYPDRIGWRETTAVAEGLALASSTVPARSASHRLTAYPDTGSPDTLAARVVVRGAGAAAAAPGDDAPTADAGGGRGLTERFTNLVGRQRLTLSLGALAVALALLLGAGHALAPGHGKTAMAAYLLGGGGRIRQALTIAAGVVATHTLGVLLLGLLLAASLHVAPQAVYGWLRLGTGLLLAAVGATLLARALTATGHRHHHHHGHGHPHGPSPPGVPHRRTLLAVGLAGGLSPSPSAVVVLLGAAALGRAWFGVLLVVAYGVGMAAGLAGLGLALARVGHRLAHAGTGPRWVAVRRHLPAITAAAILVAGLGLAATSLAGLRPG